MVTTHISSELAIGSICFFFDLGGWKKCYERWGGGHFMDDYVCTKCHDLRIFPRVAKPLIEMVLACFFSSYSFLQTGVF